MSGEQNCKSEDSDHTSETGGLVTTLSMNSSNVNILNDVVPVCKPCRSKAEVEDSESKINPSYTHLKTSE